MKAREPSVTWAPSLKLRRGAPLHHRLLRSITYRAAASTQNAHGTGKPATLGISGHYGRAQIAGTAGAADAEVASSGVAGDFSFPLVRRVSLAGKVFEPDVLDELLRLRDDVDQIEAHQGRTLPTEPIATTRD